MQGRVVLDNYTGHALHTSGCERYFQVALSNAKTQQVPGWLDCLQQFTFPTGESSYPVTVTASYLECGTGSPQVGLRPCVNNRPPPLPSGEYQVTLIQSGSIVAAPPPVTVRVVPRAMSGSTDDDLGVWEPFRVTDVQELMAGADILWWLSGGEALDVFLGRSSRPHADIDISLRRSDLRPFREHVFARLDLKIAHDGRLRVLSDGALDDDVHGLWARETEHGPWRLQINLEPVDGGEWVYRREPRIRLPIERVVRRRGSLPYVDPAVQLLWKAKDTRAKDEQDFTAVVPQLTAEQRRWLAGAIALSHPASPWAARLTT